MGRYEGTQWEMQPALLAMKNTRLSNRLRQVASPMRWRVRSSTVRSSQ